MSSSAPTPVVAVAQPLAGGTLATQAGDLLPLADGLGLLLAGQLTLSAYALSGAALPAPEAWSSLHLLAWIAAVVAPFILYDANFGRLAGAGRHATLAGAFARRFLLLLGVTGAIAFAGHWLDAAPAGWLFAWPGAALLATAPGRIWLARHLQHRARRGELPADLPAVGQVGDALPVVLLADRPIRHWSAVLKSGADRVLAAGLTLLLLPLLAGIALAIRLDSPGPVLFTQRRHGFNNGEFDIYKFRTMRVATDGAGAALQQTVRGDPRVTRVGRFLRKWSLDELPQVFNVLGGTMSLVGPRPHAVNMRTEQRLGHEIIDAYPHRHRVRPGIAGWAQINGARGATDTAAQLQRRITLDLHYIQNWSPLLDAKILVLTFREVLRATNAF
jgi:lipopolysaccharide/colanic/teichoic acid biosynthesis glycosyltransferase